MKLYRVLHLATRLAKKSINFCSGKCWTVCIGSRYWVGANKEFVVPQIKTIYGLMETENKFTKLSSAIFGADTETTVFHNHVNSCFDTPYINTDKELRSSWKYSVAFFSRSFHKNSLHPIFRLSHWFLNMTYTGSSANLDNPYYRFDVRGRSFSKALSSSDSNSFGSRAYFLTVSRPAGLQVENVHLDDGGVSKTFTIYPIHSMINESNK